MFSNFTKTDPFHVDGNICKMPEKRILPRTPWVLFSPFIDDVYIQIVRKHFLIMHILVHQQKFLVDSFEKTHVQIHSSGVAVWKQRCEFCKVVHITDTEEFATPISLPVVQYFWNRIRTIDHISKQPFQTTGCQCFSILFRHRADIHSILERAGDWLNTCFPESIQVRLKSEVFVSPVELIHDPVCFGCIRDLLHEVGYQLLIEFHPCPDLRCRSIIDCRTIKWGKQHCRTKTDSGIFLKSFLYCWIGITSVISPEFPPLHAFACKIVKAGIHMVEKQFIFILSAKLLPVCQIKLDLFGIRQWKV